MKTTQFDLSVEAEDLVGADAQPGDISDDARACSEAVATARQRNHTPQHEAQP